MDFSFDIHIYVKTNVPTPPKLFSHPSSAAEVGQEVVAHAACKIS